MKKLGLCLFVAAALMTFSCTGGWRHPDEGRMDLCQSMDYKKYLAPGARGSESLIRLGMPGPEVMKHRLCIRQQRVLVGPSGSRDGCEAEYGGLHYMLAFDKGGRLCHISTRSRELILEGGTGPGSTLASIKGVYGGYSLIPMRGYGRMVLVRGGEVFGFEWEDSGRVKSDERASWVELTHIPRKP